MNPIENFGAYAADFEKTYLDDDWSRLEKYFAEDAEYEVKGVAAFSCKIKGRDAILRGLKRSVNGFDRKCKRSGSLRGTPTFEGNQARVGWTVAYNRPQAPEIALPGGSVADYEGDRITRMVDTFEVVEAEINEWLEKYGADLDPSYV